MDILRHFLDIDTTFFTVLEYPMSYIEFFGTLFSVWCVWLTARGRVLNWPVGIVGTLLFSALFYQIRLYSDLLEQVYFLLSGFAGWWMWLHPPTRAADGANERAVTRNGPRTNLLWGAGIVVFTVVLASMMGHLHEWFPSVFPEPASFAGLDAFTTVMSFAAQWLLVQKKLESWVLWIIIDIIGIWLYYTKGVKLIALEYVLFLAIATKGLVDWHRAECTHRRAIAASS